MSPHPLGLGLWAVRSVIDLAALVPLGLADGGHTEPSVIVKTQNLGYIIQVSMELLVPLCILPVQALPVLPCRSQVATHLPGHPSIMDMAFLGLHDLQVCVTPAESDREEL